MVVSVGMGLSACEQPEPGQFTATGTIIPQAQVAVGTAIFSDGTTATGAVAIPSSTPTVVPTPCLTFTSTPIPSPTQPPLTGDALIAYNTYVALRDHAGWWNNYAVGSITSLDFLEIILSIEFSGEVMKRVDSNLLKETVVRNYYVKCESFTGHPCSPDSDTDIFTYIEEKTLLRQRPGYILQKEDDPNKNGSWNPEKPNRSKVDFAGAIRNPDPRWKRAFVVRLLNGQIYR